MAQTKLRRISHTLITVCFVTIFLFSCSIVPSPYSNKEFEEQAQRDLNEIFSKQEPVKGKVDLYEAMARAVKYNLDHHVSTMEKSIAKGLLAQAHDDLLPQLAASAGYKIRDNENGSSSKSLSTGIQNTEISTSTEKKTFTADIITVWNLLDFGVSLNQAKQQADQVLISEEQRRKTVQNIVQEIRYTYWQAVSAEHLIPEMDKLLTKVESALDRSQQMESRKTQAPRKILDYQQELIEIVQELWGMRRDLVLAKTELATLINLKPGTDFTVTESADEMLLPDFALDQLENNAMVRRPEVRIESYQTRIGATEVKKAMLQMLPGLELSLNSYYDKTKYLVNNSWLEAGFHLSWNAFNLISGKTNIENAKLQESVARKRHMSASMMVLTQVNLAYQRYYLALKEYRLSSQLVEVHRRKIFHVQAAKKAKTSREMEEIRDRTEALSAKMQHGVNFAELQASIGRVLHSIGNDPLPPKIPSDDLDFLARLMKHFEKKEFKRLSKNQVEQIEIQSPFSLKEVDNTIETLNKKGDEIDLIDQVKTNEIKGPLSKTKSHNHIKIKLQDSSDKANLPNSTKKDKSASPPVVARKGLHKRKPSTSFFVKSDKSFSNNVIHLEPTATGRSTASNIQTSSKTTIKRTTPSEDTNDRVSAAAFNKKKHDIARHSSILPPKEHDHPPATDHPAFIMEKNVTVGPDNNVNIHKKSGHD